MSLLQELTERLKNGELDEQEIEKLEQELLTAKTILAENKKEAAEFNERVTNAVNDEEKRKRLQEIDNELDSIKLQRNKIEKRGKITSAFAMLNFLFGFIGLVLLISLNPIFKGINESTFMLRSILISLGVTSFTFMPQTLDLLSSRKLRKKLKLSEDELIKERLELIEGQSYEAILESEGEEIANKKLNRLDRNKRIEITINEQVEEDELNTTL